MGAHILHANMTRGAITPKMHARVDSDLYQAGVKTAKNMVVLRYGGMTRAPGFQYHGALKDSANATYMVPFIFNQTQVYILEFADGYVRFWNRDGQVMSGGSPYQVASPFAAADLANIKYWQSGDEVYLACDGYKPRILTRSSETSWAFSEYDPKDGPFKDINETGTSFTLSDYGSVVPTMTNNTTPSGTVADSAGSANAYKVFARNDTSTAYYVLAAATSGWISYTFASGTKVVDGYMLKAPSIRTERMITSWKFQGYNGSNWVTLDTRNGETGWASGEWRYYDFVNTTGYSAYRIFWTATDDGSVTQTWIQRFDMHEAADSMTPITLTASSATGINDGDGFQTTDVGRHLRIMGSDGRWRWAKIAARSSTTVVTVRLYDFPLPDLDGINLWRLGAWSDTTGWPGAVGEHEGRVAWAKSDNDPFTTWLTRSADYDSFKVSDPVVDDDAITLKPGGGGVSLDPVNWIVGYKDLMLGTRAALRSYGPRDVGRAFAGGNIRRLTETNETTNPDVPAFPVSNFLLFLDQYGKRIYEAAYSTEADGYLAQEASVLNEHLVRRGVTRWAFQSSPHRVLWCVTADGNMLAVTYDRDQKVFGITERLIDGTADDVCVLPGDGDDDVFVTVRRTINGSVAGYMELMAPFYEDDDHDYPVYFDSAAVVTGTGLTAVTGADHLEGETVGIWVDGFDVGDAIVTSGGFSLPAGDGLGWPTYEGSGNTIVYGLRNRWDMALLKASRWGAKDERGLGYPVRAANGTLHLYQSAGIEAGTEESTDLWLPEDSNTDTSVLLTGDFDLGTVDAKWKQGGVLALGGNKAYPVTVNGVTVEVEGSM